VTFTDGTTTVCSAVTLSTTAPYTATCPQTYQAVGSHTVNASYNGDTNTAGSQTAAQTAEPPAQVTVTKAGTSTSLCATTSPNQCTTSLNFGQPITFSATVSVSAPSTAGPALTGTVTFTLDGQSLASAGALARGVANSVAVYNLAPGSHTVVAKYSGDANYSESTGNLSPTVTCTQTVNVAVTGSVTVSGSTCVEAGGSVSGPVTILPGGSLAVIGGSLNGPVTGKGVVSALICGATIGGPMTLTGATGPVALGGPAGSACGPDQFNGPVTITGGSAPLTITDDSIVGPLIVTSNSGSVSVTSNNVGGPVTVSSNSSPTAATVSGNTITGPLGCTMNSVAPTDAGVLNHGGPASGQCAGLG
jgi:hypothetical protein